MFVDFYTHINSVEPFRVSLYPTSDGMVRYDNAGPVWKVYQVPGYSSSKDQYNQSIIYEAKWPQSIRTWSFNSMPQKRLISHFKISVSKILPHNHLSSQSAWLEQNVIKKNYLVLIYNT